MLIINTSKNVTKERKQYCGEYIYIQQRRLYTQAANHHVKGISAWVKHQLIFLQSSITQFIHAIGVDI